MARSFIQSRSCHSTTAKKRVRNRREMSKLSPALKALINVPSARPGTIAAPKHIARVYERIAQDAAEKNIGRPSWLALSTAATMTMNSPESLTELYHVAAKEPSDRTVVAEFMREVGLKCISFNGIPRTINCLGAFRTSLPATVLESLSRTSTRTPNPENISSIATRGLELWKSIYNPFDEKLIDKLADSHPDLPVHILNSHYGALLSDPTERHGLGSVGRVLTSVVAVSCLRAQTGVGPQVISHIFGLRKALEDGTFKTDNQEDIKGAEWLASDEGNTWILNSVDSIVHAIGEGEGSTFAPTRTSKL